MGNILSEPVRTKETDSDRNNKYHYALSAMQGWRVSMEDAHTAVLNVDGNENDCFFGVYDGHGGETVSKYISEHVHKTLFEEESYKNKDYKQALKNAFFKVDSDIEKIPSLNAQITGSTAIVTLIKDNKIYCANSGDSRAVMCKGDETVPLSFDHKPKNPEEERRIINAGGRVEMDRVNGSLALSRAFGDFEFKGDETLSTEEQMVTVDPEFTVTEITDDVEFMILACDGVWDVQTSEEAVNFVRGRIAKGVPLPTIADLLVDACCSERRTGFMNEVGLDNISCIIVQFSHKESEKAKEKEDEKESVV